MKQLPLHYNWPSKSHDPEIVAWAQVEFSRALAAAKTHGLIGIPKPPFNLRDVCQWMGLSGYYEHGTTQVNVNQIKGVDGSCTEFDRSFRPRVSGDLQAAWVKQFATLRYGFEPPLLKLYQWGDVYFVLFEDQRVWVSVLRWFGVKIAKAHVIGPMTAKTPPPTLDGLEKWERETESPGYHFLD